MSATTELLSSELLVLEKQIKVLTESGNTGEELVNLQKQYSDVRTKLLSAAQALNENKKLLKD